MRTQPHPAQFTFRFLVITLLAAALFAVTAQPAHAKGQMQATMLQPIPADAEPGSMVTARWKLQVKADEKFEPFGAGEVFVRFVGRAAGETSEVITSGTGTFSANVKVPPSGIKKVEIGMVGDQVSGNARDRRGDYLFPIKGQTLIQPEPQSSFGSTVWIAAGLIGVVLIALLIALATKRRPPAHAAAG